MSLIRALESGSIYIGCRRRTRKHLQHCLLILSAFFLLSSCNSKKYLTADQSFLFKNKINIKSDHQVDDKSALKERLARSYAQPATRGFIPRHVFYYQYIRRLERDSIRRIYYDSLGLPPPPMRRQWSESKLVKFRPVIYDSAKAELTTQNFEQVLNLAGYRHAEATFEAKTRNKETWVYYKVDPGPRIYIDTFMIASEDPAIRSIIGTRVGKTFFKEESPLDIELFKKEQFRIVTDLQDHGYALFDETYIAPLEVDTSGGYVRATLRILDENDSTFHKRFYVGGQTVYDNYSLTDTSALFDTVVSGIRYIHPEPVMTLKPEAIQRNIFLKQGQLTRRQDYSQTLKNLSRMELIRFVTPDLEVDTTSSDTPYINYTFFITRNRKIILNGFAELTYANISLSNRSLLGTSVSGNYRDLNLFKGAEILNINVEAGVEFNFFDRSDEIERGAINSENYLIGLNLAFPRFMDPLGLYGTIGGRRFEDQPSDVHNRVLRWLLFESVSRLNLSYNRVNIHELYKYYSVNAGLSYVMVPDEYRKLTIDRMGIDLYVPTPTTTFTTKVLSRSRLLQESFGKYFFTGLLFRRYAYEFNAPLKIKTGYFSHLHSAEISGSEVLLLNLLYNTLAKTENEFTLGTEIPGDSVSNLIRFSHFLKGEFDVRFYYNFNSSVQFACKLNTGLAAPFGKFSRQVPYLKQFYVGGPISNRAWQVRELGPGSYRDPEAQDIEFSFYQTGDIKLDMSAELRFPLFWYLDGAVFIDAANVWTIKKDPQRENKTHFQLRDFLSELGIGYGVGFRLDLDYFVIRLDLGYKLHSPYDLNENGNRWYSNRFPHDPITQIAVGYPF